MPTFHKDSIFSSQIYKKSIIQKIFLIQKSSNVTSNLSNRIIILAANPCRIHAIKNIDFGTSRTEKIRESAKFGEYVSEIEALMDEVNKK